MHDMTSAERSLTPMTPNPLTLVRTPVEVGTDPAARLQFLQELADDSEYVALLRRASEKVSYTCTTPSEALSDY